MAGNVALCADSASLGHPYLIGLSGENLCAQEWLRLFSSGDDARRFLRNDRTVDEVWVASSDDIEPINLAASLKLDRADRRVCLLAFQGTGSLKSRASAAGIDVTFSRQAFAARYAAMKAMRAPRQPDQPLAGAGDRGFPSAADGMRHLPLGSAGGFGNAPAEAACAPAGPAGGRLEGDGSANAGMRAPAEAPAEAASCPEALPHPSKVLAPAGGQAFLLPVVSGSGGAGKSTIAALAAAFAQGMGYRTLLLDFDLQFGDMREMLGMPDALGADEALASPARLAQLAPRGMLPALLGAPRRLEDAEAMAGGLSRLLDEACGRFEVVVANTGAAWADHHAALLERCSKALFLVDQRPSSLRACRHALDLCVRCGIATGPFVFAVNRCSKGAPYTSIDVSCALRGARAIELRDGGRDVDEILSAGQPLDLIAAKNDLCISLENALADLLPSRPGMPEERVGKPRSGSLLFRKGRRRRKGGLPCLC